MSSVSSPAAAAAAAPSPLSAQFGLANLGNTCFVNAMLQAFRLCGPLCSIFLQAEPVTIREASDRAGFVSAFQTLMRDFWRSAPPPDTHPTMMPRGFFQAFRRTLVETEAYWYQPGRQGDVQEAIQYLLESLHDGLHFKPSMTLRGEATTPREAAHMKSLESWIQFWSKEYSPIVKNFYGQNQIKMVCACGESSVRYEPFLLCKVPIKDGTVKGAEAPTWDACFAEEHKPETVEDYRCEKCNVRGRVVKTSAFSHLPPVAVVSLKRYTNSQMKIRARVPFDLEGFDFAPYMASEFVRRDAAGAAMRHNPFTGKEEPTVYEAVAVLEHHGSTHGGHYLMFAKQEGRWVEYDDSSVRYTFPDRVVSPDSYIFFLVPKHQVAATNASFAHTITQFRAAEAERAPELAAAAEVPASAGAGTGASPTFEESVYPPFSGIPTPPRDFAGFSAFAGFREFERYQDLDGVRGMEDMHRRMGLEGMPFEGTPLAHGGELVEELDSAEGATAAAATATAAAATATATAAADVREIRVPLETLQDVTVDIEGSPSVGTILLPSELAGISGARPRLCGDEPSGTPAKADGVA